MAGAFFWQVKGVVAAVVGVNLCLLLFSLCIAAGKNRTMVLLKDFANESPASFKNIPGRVMGVSPDERTGEARG